MVIRTQKDKKLQTLIEVCTDFASLSHTTNVHRPAEQVFALEEEDDREEEDGVPPEIGAVDGWVDRSDGPQRRNGGPPQGNEI